MRTSPVPRVRRPSRLFPLMLLLLPVPLLSCGDDSSITGPPDALYSLTGSGIEGRVTESDGDPIAGATVTVLDASTGATVNSGSSDAQGQYEVPVADGTYDVRVQAPGFNAQIIGDVTVSGATTLNVVLLRSVTFSGRVLDDEGNPIPGQFVFLSAGSIFSSATTDAEGMFSFSTTEGTYTLGLRNHSNVVGAPNGYSVNIGGFEITGDRSIDLVLPVVALDVTVVDPDGQPVNETSLRTRQLTNSSSCLSTQITVSGLGGSAFWCPFSQTGTDNVAEMWFFPIESGFAVVGTPPAGSSVGTGSHELPGGLTTDAAITLVLPATVRFSGLVQTEDGTPLAGQQIRLFEGGSVVTANTGADGRFELFASPESYDLLRLERGAGDAPYGMSSYSVDVRPFGLAEDTDVVMTLPAHTLTVTVTDPAGLPVEGATFSTCANGRGFELFDGGTASSARACVSALSDGAGVLAASLFPSDFSQQGTVFPPTASDLLAARFTIPPMDADKSVDVQLTRSVVVSGRLVDRAGNPVTNTTIGFSGGGLGFSGSTGTDGNFSVAVQPGLDLSLGLTRFGPLLPTIPDWLSLNVGRLTFEEDTDLGDVVLPNVLLRVTVIDPAGVPVVGAHITSGLIFNTGGFQVLSGQSANGWQRMRGTTGADGVAVVGMLPTLQDFVITVSPPTGSSLQQVQVEVPRITGDATLAVIAPPSNDQPFAVITPLDPVADEGTTITFDGSASSDPDGSGLEFLWTLPDGSSATTSSVSLDLPDDGTFPVTLRVTDAGGGTDDLTSTATIRNAVPAVSLDAPGGARIGSPFTVSGSFSDPGVGDAPWTISVDWGDGTSGPDQEVTSQGAFAAEHTYTAPGSFTVEVRVTDKDGGRGSASVAIEVAGDNAPPVADAGGPYAADEGMPVVFDATGSSDEDGDPLVYDWDFGDGTTASDAGPAPSHAYADDGDYTVTVTVRDPDGEESSASAEASVANVAPAVSLDAISDVLTLEDAAGSGSFSDPGADDWSATVDYGEGGGHEALTLAPDGTFPLSHAYADDGVYTVTVRVTDDDGGVGSAEVDVTVLNRAPTAAAGADVVVECTEAALGGTTVDLDGSASSDEDGSVVAWTWTDAAGRTVATGATPSVVLGHGRHVLTLTVTDDDGDTGSDQVTVDVEDTTAPALAFELQVTELWSPNHKMVTVATGIGATDACDVAPDVDIEVTSNEPVDSTGDGNTEPDWRVVSGPDGTYALELRAERKGDGSDRIYTVTVTATDASGHVTRRTGEVRVPHDRRRDG